MTTKATGAPSGAGRVLDRLERLYALGGGTGANRPGLSAAEQAAHELVAGWMEEAGLAVEVDPVGNLVGRLPGTRPELPEVWTGSHLDSVPDGGRFDGALGVVGGLEAVSLAASRGPHEHTLAVVAFRDEEGSRFGRGLFGSRALCGRLAVDDLDQRDAGGTTVHEALAALGLARPDPAGWLDPPPAAFLECHVEQGAVLAARDAPLGVVTGIVGVARGSAEFAGLARHAGTTPMDAREDALCAAAEFVLRLRDAARAVDGAVATVGRIEVEPGAVNVVPARAWVSVDVRAPDRGRLDAVLRAVPEARVHVTDPVPTAAGPTRALREALAAAGLPVAELASGAGHDAMVLAAAGVPTGLLFVRSLADGASHCPEEETSGDDVALAVDVLAAALLRLAA
jgi:hydantoinase/carbamoylase family amidase